MIEEQRICEQCGESYSTTVKHQKYCTTRCRKYHWLEKKGFKDISSLVKRMDGLEEKIATLETAVRLMDAIAVYRKPTDKDQEVFKHMIVKKE